MEKKSKNRKMIWWYTMVGIIIGRTFNNIFDNQIVSFFDFLVNFRKNIFEQFSNRYVFF